MATCPKEKMTNKKMTELPYCQCSAYGDEKVNFAQCVIDRGSYPCYYVLMPESRWYIVSESKLINKILKIECKLRGMIWMIKHPYYRKTKGGTKHE